MIMNNGGLLWADSEVMGFHKKWGISGIIDQLLNLYQEELHKLIS